MAWEQRAGRRYYYRKVRDGGQVRSKYIGSGDLGRFCAQSDRDERRARKAERDALRALQQAEADIDRQLASAEATIAALTADALTAAGYHRHKGQWRRKRHGNQEAASEDSGRAIGVP